MSVLEVDVQLSRPGRDWRLVLRSDVRRIGIFGPSGVGKTTLLRVLAGLEPGARGRVYLEGRVLQEGTRMVPAWERQVGWLPQEATLLPHVSVRENLCWGGASARDAARMAESLGVDHLLSRRPRHLSGGERQRVALGRALLSGHRLLLLDEPFSALDPELRERAAAVVQAHCQPEGPVLVLVSHHRPDLGRLCEERWEARSDGSLRRDG